MRERKGDNAKFKKDDGMEAFEKIAEMEMPSNKNRGLVLSECSTGGYKIAQRVRVNTEVGAANMFLKGAIKLESIKDLEEFEKFISNAVEEVKAGDENGDNEDSWD